MVEKHRELIEVQSLNFSVFAGLTLSYDLDADGLSNEMRVRSDEKQKNANINLYQSS